MQIKHFTKFNTHSWQIRKQNLGELEIKGSFLSPIESLVKNLKLKTESIYFTIGSKTRQSLLSSSLNLILEVVP